MSPDDNEIPDRTDALHALHARVAAEIGDASNGHRAKEAPVLVDGSDARVLDDDVLLSKARQARNGSKFSQLWAGDISGYASRSEADLALCNLLAFWADRNTITMDRLFRRSGLMRSKWDTRHGAETYGTMTVAKANAQCGDTYQGRHHTVTTSSVTVADADPAQHRATASDARADLADAELILKPEALYGLAGRVVEAIDPHTEASKVATLAHLLVGLGNLIGPDPHAMVGHDVHPCRLNVALVGASSKGRKGMSRSAVMAILRGVDEAWSTTRVVSGLSTSEGLIYHVRDAREEKQPVKNHGRVVDYESVIVDHGVDDKRLFVEEPEMASVLRRMDREGNALSATLRQAWDSGGLRTLTRGSPLQATNAHISIVSHITVEELRLNLTHSDRANGFANRFLFLLAKRSKCLPDPRPLSRAAIEHLAATLGEVRAFARTAGEIPRDAEAGELWADIYPALSAERPGMFGAVTARAEAQVLRLSVLYAVLDCSFTVRLAHLLAGLALWDYADASARIIFGAQVGDPIADRILAALRTQGSQTRTQIVDLFNRHVNAERIAMALAALETQGKARMTEHETGGRPAEHWEAI